MIGGTQTAGKAGMVVPTDAVEATEAVMIAFATVTEQAIQTLINTQQREIDDLYAIADKLLIQSNSTKTSLAKRKLKNIVEEEDEEITTKKNRPSTEDQYDKMDKIQNDTYFVNFNPLTSNNEKHSILAVTTIVNENDGSSLADTTSDGRRTKRKASQKAEVMNNKMLNLKLTHKMRRNNSTESNASEAVNKKDDEITISKEYAENVESTIVISETVNITSNITVKTQQKPLEDITDSNNILKHKIVETQQNPTEDDKINCSDGTYIMPPPTALIKTKKKTAGARSKKNLHSTSDSQIDSENTSSIENRSSRRLRTKHETADSSVTSDKRLTRSTRSQNANTSTVSSKAETVLDTTETIHTSTGRSKSTRKKKSKSINDKTSSQESEEKDEKTNDQSNENQTTVEQAARNKRTKRGKKDIDADLKEPQSDTIKTTNAATIDEEVKTDENKDAEIIQKASEPGFNNPTVVIEKLVMSANENVNTSDSNVTKTTTAKEKNPESDLQDRGNPPEVILLDETVVIGKGLQTSTPHSAKTQNIPFNETVIITESNEKKLTNNVDKQNVAKKTNEQVPFDPSCSLLPNDCSEVEETPPKAAYTKPFPKNIKLIKENENLNQSPVKKQVKHFENLAKLSKTKADPRVKINRIQTRGNSTEPIQVIQEISSTESSLEEFKLSNLDKAGKNKLTPSKLKKNIVKCNLPIPITNKQIGNATKNSTSRHGSNATNAQPVSRSEKDDPSQKRLLLNQAKVEEQKRKREEKFRAAALAREAQDKLKQAQLERAQKEREEKIRQIQEEREEKARQIQEERLRDAEKRRQIQEKRAAEQEAQNQALNKLKEMEMENIPKKHVRTLNTPLKMTGDQKDVNNPAKSAREIFDAMIEEDERLENSKSSDSERKKIEHNRRPSWAKHENLDKAIKTQRYIHTDVIDKLYSTTIFSPNLLEIFPSIDRNKLKRTSSAVWKTPPRSSLMPKF